MKLTSVAVSEAAAAASLARSADADEALRCSFIVNLYPITLIPNSVYSGPPGTAAGLLLSSRSILSWDYLRSFYQPWFSSLLSAKSGTHVLSLRRSLPF